MNVNVIGPAGAPEPVNVVVIVPETGKQHVVLDHVTALNVFVAVYLVKLWNRVTVPVIARFADEEPSPLVAPFAFAPVIVRVG